MNTCTEAIEVDDESTLAAHALDHGIRTKSGFSSLYRVFVVRHSEKEMLTINEQNLINSFNTVRPYGLNVANPIGLTQNFNFNNV